MHEVFANVMTVELKSNIKKLIQIIERINIKIEEKRKVLEVSSVSRGKNRAEEHTNFQINYKQILEM